MKHSVSTGERERERELVEQSNCLVCTGRRVRATKYDQEEKKRAHWKRCRERDGGSKICLEYSVI